MTSKKSPLLGLPYIDLPHTKWIERAAFYLLRNWMWTTVLACFLLVTSLISAFVLIARFTGQDFSHLKILSLILLTTPVVQAAILASTFIEGGAARPWMIRAALASTTDEEQAFFYDRILNISTSEFRDDPLSRGELFRLFKQARGSFGDKTRRKREELIAARSAQIEQLYAIDDDQAASS